MSSIVFLYSILVKVGSSLQSPLLLIIRLFWGFCFFSTGLGKLMQMPEVIPYFTGLGLPCPVFSAYLASYIELIGGLCLFFGFATRLAAIPLLCNMIVAYLFTEMVAIKMFLVDPVHFVTRTPFTFLFATLLLFVFGPGALSIDQILKKVYTKKKIN